MQGLAADVGREAIITHLANVLGPRFPRASRRQMRAWVRRELMLAFPPTCWIDLAAIPARGHA
jgi:hypothetical protein